MIGLLVIAQLAMVAHAPDTATTCAPFSITVAARAPGNIPPRITPPASSPALQLLKTTTTSRIERDGIGRPSALTEATFTVATDGFGRVVLPPVTASVGATRASATPLPVDVHATGILSPNVIVRAWLDRAGLGEGSDTLFVGQQVDYVVDVQLNEPARQRLRRNPTFFPPEMPGVLAYDLAPPAPLTRVGRRCFETLSYRRALFPLFGGRTTIAPAALTYSLPLSTSFFSREESFELRTDSVRFVAVDVPAAGRPADFAGAVGALAATSRLSTTQARMGDPVVLTLRLEGAGNVKLWPRPLLAVPWASVAPGGERVKVDTSTARVRGSKEFDWLLTPRQAGRQDVPAIGYSYFDADRSSYAESATTPLALDVAAAILAVVDSAPPARLALRRTLREELPPPVPTRPWFWVLLAVAPVPAAARRVRDRLRRRGDAVSPMRRLRQTAGRSERLSARQVRRLFLDAVAERVPSAAGPTQRDAFVRALRRAGVTTATANAAGDLLERLDTAAFSAAGPVEGDTLMTVSARVNEIDAEAIRLPRPSGKLRLIGVVLCVAAASGVLNALPDGVTNSFRLGVEAFDQAAFKTAEQHFQRVVSRAPRAVDGWANLGAAAFSAGDSATAVRAWQRALRLDPLDDEARARIDAVQLAPMRALGYVPPFPVNVLALAALASWVLAWVLLGVPVHRRPEQARAMAGGAIAVAVVLLASAIEVHKRLDPRGLAVLRTNRLLLDAPAASAAGASAALGETGMIGAREGAWVHIAFDGARAGWVPLASVLPLDEIAPPLD